MIQAILVAVGGSLIAALVSIITLFTNRKWAKDDKADAVLLKLNEIEIKLNTHIEADNLAQVKQARSRILRFADECSRGEKHSKEFFDSVLEDIDMYEDYCADHPQFENNKTTASKRVILQVFNDCLINHKFI